MDENDAIESSLSHQLLRTVGELYVMIVPAVAVFVLLTTSSGNRGMFAAILLVPIAFCYASIAVRSVSLTAAAWRKRRSRANVGRELLDLGGEYRILSRCSVTPGREDHIAIGPNGIFVILGCDDSGRVTVSSRRLFVNARLPWRDLIDDCRIDSLRVRERVRHVVGRPLPVHSILCFARALVAVGQEIQGVKVVQAARLAPLLKSTPVTAPLSREDVEMAAAALTEPRKGVRPQTVVRRPRRARSSLQAERRLALVGRMPARHRDA